MNEELRMDQLEHVNAGTAIISYDYMNIGFDTLREKYDLKNCTYQEATAYRDELVINNPQMSNKEFDIFCKAQFKAKGWI